MIKDTIKKLIYNSLNEYLKIDTPTLLIWLYKRYPKYYYLWWSLYQIKSFMGFFIFVYAMWFISHTCIPTIMCKSYIDMIDNAYNLTKMNLSNNALVD